MLKRYGRYKKDLNQTCRLNLQCLGERVNGNVRFGAWVTGISIVLSVKH